MRWLIFENYLLNRYCILTLAVTTKTSYAGKKIESSTLFFFAMEISHVINPSLSDPSGSGWYHNTNKNIFEPVMAKLAPGPVSILRLTVCNCKTKCISNRRKCRKTDLAAPRCVVVRIARTIRRIRKWFWTIRVDMMEINYI